MKKLLKLISQFILLLFWYKTKKQFAIEVSFKDLNYRENTLYTYYRVLGIPIAIPIDECNSLNENKLKNWKTNYFKNTNKYLKTYYYENTEFNK